VVSSEEVAGDLKRVTFARTPIMSSYLLAFIVGEFDFVEGTDSNNVLVRVYTPVGKADQGQFALDVRRRGWLGVTASHDYQVLVGVGFDRISFRCELCCYTETSTCDVEYYGEGSVVFLCTTTAAAAEG